MVFECFVQEDGLLGCCFQGGSGGELLIDFWCSENMALISGGSPVVLFRCSVAIGWLDGGASGFV